MIDIVEVHKMNKIDLFSLGNQRRYLIDVSTMLRNHDLSCLLIDEIPCFRTLSSDFADITTLTSDFIDKITILLSSDPSVELTGLSTIEKLHCLPLPLLSEMLNFEWNNYKELELIWDIIEGKPPFKTSLKLSELMKSTDSLKCYIMYIYMILKKNQRLYSDIVNKDESGNLTTILPKSLTPILLRKLTTILSRNFLKRMKDNHSAIRSIWKGRNSGEMLQGKGLNTRTSGLFTIYFFKFGLSQLQFYLKFL